MNEQLPIKNIFLNGIYMPFEHYKELIRLGWPYAFLILASSFFPEKTDSFIFNSSYFILICIAGVLGGVGCHRVFLLPSEPVSETNTIRWGSRETNFMLKFFGIGLLGSIFLIPIVVLVSSYLEGVEFFAAGRNEALSGLIFTFALMPVYYFISRWSLILPDSAVDNDNTFSWAWSVSSDYSFRLFILIGALPLSAHFLFALLITFLEPSIIFGLIENTMWLIVAVIEICFLSLSYEWIVSKQESEDEELYGRS